MHGGKDSCGQLTGVTFLGSHCVWRIRSVAFASQIHASAVVLYKSLCEKGARDVRMQVSVLKHLIMWIGMLCLVVLRSYYVLRKLPSCPRRMVLVMSSSWGNVSPVHLCCRGKSEKTMILLVPVVPPVVISMLWETWMLPASQLQLHVGFCVGWRKTPCFFQHCVILPCVWWLRLIHWEMNISWCHLVLFLMWNELPALSAC